MNKGDQYERISHLLCHDDTADGDGLIGASLLMAGALTLSPHNSNIATAATAVPIAYQPFAACVSNRESHGNYKARRAEAGSSAAGRWQFLDLQWRVNGGITWMVRDRLVNFGMNVRDANQIRVKLQRTKINKWTPVMQDVAFAEVVTRPRGYTHWMITGSKCNRLAVK